ncbi:hypothetical protein [Jeotgalibacillus soli]|uniref:Uncharacterized protein n=1 Tax=Jeotgalibacillus soli TaxID=889306 RepID=A0A0C2S2N0_9BACL|nr:hypothetical protein [Jeotgalibacillus soli]KIL48284.1 hypothetical protein KP78_17310 [Jeotgalibacillus soli]
MFNEVEYQITIVQKLLDLTNGQIQEYEEKVLYEKRKISEIKIQLIILEELKNMYEDLENENIDHDINLFSEEQATLMTRLAEVEKQKPHNYYARRDVYTIVLDRLKAELNEDEKPDEETQAKAI